MADAVQADGAEDFPHSPIMERAHQVEHAGNINIPGVQISYIVGAYFPRRGRRLLRVTWQ